VPLIAASLVLHVVGHSISVMNHQLSLLKHINGEMQCSDYLCTQLMVVDSVFLFVIVEEVNAVIIAGIPYRTLPTQNSGQRSTLLCFLPGLCGIKNGISPTI